MRTRSLRTQLVAVLALTALATLVAVAVGTAIGVRADARDDTVADLAAEVEGFANVIGAFNRPTGPGLAPAERLSLGRAFRVADLDAVAVSPAGELLGDSPAGLPPEALTNAELGRRPTSGSVGDVAWATAPLRIRSGDGTRLALVVTRQIDRGVGRAGGWFVVAGVLTLALAAAAGAAVAARLVAPLAQLSRATRAIASGQHSDTEVGDDAPSEVRALADDIDQMAADLAASRRRERDFLLSVSHELRTPLTAIGGFAEALADGAADPARAAEVIGVESARLERLVNDLLDLARLDTDRFTLRPEPLDVAASVAATAEAIGTSAATWGVGVKAIGTDDAAPATLDPDRLAQVLANIVENAASLAASEVAVTVTTPEPSVIVVTIDDDGRGVAPAERDRIFERLHSARPRAAGRPGGTGLGLTIAGELVEAMGGTIWVGDSPLGGARFEIRLPTDPSSR